MPEQTGNIALWDDVGRIHHQDQDQDSGNNRRDESASSPSSTAGGAVEDAVAAAGGWVALPSVQERVEQLCRRMPAFHRLRTNVQALKQELLDHQNEQLLLNAPLSFSVLFVMHQKIMLPLKLHASILYGVIHSDPWLASTGLDQSNESTSLDQYMGDVFALTFLMSFSDLGIVEGGPTNAACVRQLRQRQPPSSEASQCYRSWVYMHSSVLRVKTFTQEQQVRLGIPSELCQVSEMIPNDCYLSEVFMTSEISLKIHEFGRLGPSFRGWDVPRVRELSARCLFAFFVTDNVHFHGETTRTAMEWLCLVHDQARKTRPMTVTPPSIRLCRPNVRS
jgi:hypothetical protein